MTGSASARMSARSSEKLHIGTAGHAKALQILLAAVAEDLTEEKGWECQKKKDEKKIKINGKFGGSDHLSFPWLRNLSDYQWLQHRWEVTEAQGVCMQRLKDAQSRDM